MPREAESDLTRNDQYWRRDESGALIMPELQSEYLDWLLADDKADVRTDDDWVRGKPVSRETVKKWRQDARFKEMWDKRATERNVSPERLHRVIDMLYDAAIKTGDVGAAQKFLAYAEKLMPPREIKRDASVAHLSDDELIAEMQALLQEGL